MLKLYRTRFTAKQLRALAVHCYYFCPERRAPELCNGKECEYWAVCRDLERLADYAVILADEQEATTSKK